jgi:hypothetical protein
MIALAQQLPVEVERYIDRFVARRRLQRLLRAAARAMCFTIVWALTWCLIDRLVALDPMTRAIALGLNIVIAMLILARPMSALLRRADVNVAAAEIERREPRLSQRLRTITSRMSDGGEYRSSRELLDALSRQVVAEVRDRNPRALLSWRPVIRPAAACAAWMVVAWAMSFSSWLDLPTLTKRYFSPFGDAGPVTTTRLIVTPGDAQVTQGDPLRVQASAMRLAAGGALALHVRAVSDVSTASTAQPWHVESMTAMPDGKFEGQIARVDRDLEYFLTGGDARSDLFRVTMLPRPAVKRFRIRYMYPPHTALAPREVENETGAIEAPAGTDVTLAIETTEPISYAIMTVGAESIRMSPAGQSGSSLSAVQTTFNLHADRRYTLRMVSARGVSGVFRGGTIRAIADRAPVAQFREAASLKREVTGDDVLPVAYLAVDDYALARLDLHVRVIRKSGAEANLALAVPLTRGQREVQGVLPLELGRYALDGGDEIELRLQAEDRAGQFALSVPVKLAVTAAASAQPAPAPASAPLVDKGNSDGPA